jgi:hypothetical protein
MAEIDTISRNSTYAVGTLGKEEMEDKIRREEEAAALEEDDDE